MKESERERERDKNIFKKRKKEVDFVQLHFY